MSSDFLIIHYQTVYDNCSPFNTHYSVLSSWLSRTRRISFWVEEANRKIKYWDSVSARKFYQNSQIQALFNCFSGSECLKMPMLNVNPYLGVSACFYILKFMSGLLSLTIRHIIYFIDGFFPICSVSWWLNILDLAVENYWDCLLLEKYPSE